MSGTIIGIANAFGSSLTPGTVGQGQAPGPTPGSGPMNFYVTPYNSGGTSTPSGQYKLGLYSTGTYNFTVNWGDGSADDVITTWNQAEATHDYGTVIPEDRFEITITPNSISSNLSFNHWYFGNRTQGDGIKVSSIGLYGGVQFYANEDVFYGCEVLTTVNQNSSNKPTFVNKDIIDSFFYKCTSLSPSFSTVYWVGPFTGTAIDFNGGTQAGLVPTGSSNARFGFDFAPTSLLRAFKNQAQFNNQFLNNWDVSGSSDFSECFEGCLRFNSPLPWTFQTGFPVIATDMFKNAVDFNQNISSWNTSSFSRTEGMFARTLPILGSVTESVFNQNISGWDTNNVQDAESMFFNAVAFNQNLTNWFSTGSLTSITSIFQNATSFNGLVTNWDTSFVTSFASIFKGASSFNRPLSTWDTSLSLLFFSAFEGATSFNQDLSSWDVSSGLYFDNMFNGATSFVGTGLSGWNTSSSISFQGMFNGASAFNQDLSSWDISSLTNASNMLTGTAISQANWDELLIGWAVQAPNIQNGVTLSDIPVLHSAGLPSASFNKLTSAPYNWTISDLGGATPPPSFSFTVDTASTEAGSSSANQYRLPLMSTGTYDFYVDWGDGGIGNQITSWNQADATHTYASSGTYTISIQAISLSGGTPSIDHISWASQDGTTITAANDRLKVQDITAWGNAVIYLNEYVFSTCANLDITTNVAPTFGSRVLRSDAFNDCSNFAGDISSWGTQAPITGDASIFYQNGGQNPNVNFNAQLTGSLFVSFSGASNFNSSLSNWDVSSVTSLSRTFQNASSFNQNISTWDVSSVSNLSNTFNGATAFDQDLSSWDVRNVTTASNMFTNSGLSAANWDALLIGWAAQGTGAGSLQANVTLSNINQYHGTVDAAAIAAYNKLTASPYNWNIVDLGELPTSVFEFDIDTAQTVTGSTNADQYRLPLMSTGTYNFTVNWGDGQSNSISTWNQAESTHTYATAGLYSISITGTIDHVSWASQNGTSFSQANDRVKIKDITDWGPAVIYLNDILFYNCPNMNITTTAAPTFGSKVMRDDYFYNCESFTGDISAWGTVASPITGSVEGILFQSFNGNPNLNFVFQRTSSEIYRAFFFCITYNNPLDNWDVSGSIDFTQAFFGCSTFNQDISGWDVSAGARFVNMFGGATSFNQDISSWDMSSATQLNFMFDGATVFNQDISTWNTSSVTTMQSTFEDATAFNQDLASWDVGSLTTASNMLTNSGISAENWDKLLIGWAAQGTGAGSLQANVTLSDISQLHGSVDSAAIAAYNKLVAAPYSWTIVDLGAAVVGNLLLDTTYGSGAEAAYSVRKLRTAYTGPAMKVQDTVGGSTQDIYFDANNNIDEAAIVSYGGSNDVFVETWYDQSGNGNDSEQPSSALRPKIYDGTSGAIVKENGRAMITATSTEEAFNIPITSTDAYKIFSVMQSHAPHVFLGSESPNDFFFIAVNGNTGAGSGANFTLSSSRLDGNAYTIGTRDDVYNELLTRRLFYADIDLNFEGTSVQNSYGGNSTYRMYNSQELIFYPASSTNPIASIEENIGDYFTQNTPLLDTYSGAAAAYSLRLLDSTYTGFAIKVQDSVGGSTQDIGFNVFGELDTVSLAAYGGSNDVFVETWYDQSGNGNNATQPSSGARPKIYNGATAAVLTQNGRPAVQAVTGTDFLNVTGAIDTTSRTIYQFSVYGRISVGGNRLRIKTGQLQEGEFNFGEKPETSTVRSSTLSGVATNASPNNQMYLRHSYADTVDVKTFLDGSATAIIDFSDANQDWSSADFSIFNNATGAGEMFLSELITYQSPQSSTRAGIETNINTFYDIYTEPVAPLLLNNYPGAAAAYSLRRIDSSYKGSAVLVQTTNNTKGPVYIGFDSNNDLDTVSLAAYGGSEEVVVAGWLDQSGNGNDAIQNSATARPVIYRDSTATTPGVVLENGKPAVEFEAPNGTSRALYLTLPTLSEGELFTAVRWLGDTGSRGGWKISTNGFDMHFPYFGGLVYDNFGSTGRYSFSPSVTLNQLNIYNTVSTSTEWTARLNGSVEKTSATNTVGFANGVLGGSIGMDHHFSEWILFDNAKSATDRTDIEDNIGGYYNIPLAGLLDENPGAAAAYSLRRLSSTYTGSAIQVQRADNVGGTTDIGFDSYGDLDTAALTTAAAGNDMAVATWYDQSGNSNDATQPSSGARPKIYDGQNGVVTDDNGKPAVEFNGTSTEISAPTVGLSVATCFIHHTNFDATARMFGQFDRFENSFFYDTVTGYWAFNNGSINLSGLPSTTSKLVYAVFDNTGGELGINGATATSGTLGVIGGQMDLRIGRRASSYWKGTASELIVYDSDESANRTNIEENIGGYYDIPLAGLLDENPGAAAAYSLRRLSSTYTGSAVQVQRADNVGGTHEIGFDGYGDLDTAALTTAAQGNDMVVVTWYDQSGNSNDVTQSSSLLRPKIYDSTDGVVDENEKPAVEFDGVNDGLIAAQSLGITATDVAIFLTYTVDALASGTVFSLQQGSSAGVRGQQNGATNYRFEIKDPAGNVTLQTSDTVGQKVKSHFLAPNSQEIFSNGLNVKSDTQTYPDYHLYTPKIGFRNNDSYFFGKVQEFVVYESDESDRRNNIEDNVGDYYGIEIAGLLDQYSGAEAGYSLRKLSNSYTGFAVQVQRADNVGGTTDIGFNADGGLDTTALTTAAAGNDMVVATWYDQSGNGNDATQGSSLLRPKIYDGQDGVITENEKPAVQLDGNDDFLLTNQSIRTATAFVVEKGAQSSRSTLFGASSIGQQYLRTDGTGIKFQNGLNSLALTGQTSRGYNLIYLDNVSSITSLANNGGSSVTASLDTVAIVDFVIGKKANQDFYKGNLQEIIIYNLSQSNFRTGIEANINFFYDIY